MKVAYNNCFGGFGLSPLAETEYRRKKGLNLTWYVGVGDYPYKSYKKVSEVSDLPVDILSALSVCASNTDLGEEIESIPEDNAFYESWWGEDNRSDTDLIEVLERLGDKANGSCASLAIQEIPDGSEYEITEYDGKEEVVPPRMEW